MALRFQYLLVNLDNNVCVKCIRGLYKLISLPFNIGSIYLFEINRTGIVVSAVVLLVLFTQMYHIFRFEYMIQMELLYNIGCYAKFTKFRVCT